MLCPRCNSENELGAHFCRFCGWPLNNDKEVETNKVSNRKRRKANKNISKIKTKKTTKNNTSNTNYSNKLYRPNQGRNLLSLLGSLIIMAIIIIALYFLINFIIVKMMGNANNYKIGNDQIPTINYVIGNRELSSIDYKIEEWNLYRKYNYENIKDPIADIIEYISYLLNNNSYTIIGVFNPTATGTVRLAAKAENAFDDVNVIDITWDENSYNLYIYNDKSVLES